jgi:hypothetical protein
MFANSLIAWCLMAAAAEPPSLETVVRQAIADCAPEIKLRQVDCAASPCVAIFDDDTTDWRKLTNCPAWTNVFGPTVATFGGHAECTDGTNKPFFLMAPDPPGGSAFGRVSQVRDWFPCGSGKNVEPPAKR